MKEFLAAEEINNFFFRIIHVLRKKNVDIFHILHHI